MSSVPRVSVIIPCFNLGQYLPEAVASVRRQTYTDFEIVVVDDGSTDGETTAAIDGLTGGDLRVVRSGENRGLSAARNLGISHARGEYVSCLDADDRFEPEWLEQGVAYLDGHPDVAFVSHWLRAFGDEQWDWTPGRSDLAALLDQNVFNGAALFRRELVDHVGGFDESMRDGCEDWEFWIRVLKTAHPGAILPAVLYEYRRRPDSMSRVMNADDGWFRLYGRLIDMHADAYREHFLDLLLRREWSIARLCRGIDAVREELSATLEPALRDRQQELTTAAARLSDEQRRERVEELETRVRHLDETRVPELEEANRAALQRVDSLLESWSWRITAPLRRMYDWVRR